MLQNSDTLGGKNQKWVGRSKKGPKIGYPLWIALYLSTFKDLIDGFSHFIYNPLSPLLIILIYFKV